jgi:hypothetical protein
LVFGDFSKPWPTRGAAFFLAPLNADYPRWLTTVGQRAKIFGLFVVIGSYLH